MAHKQFILDAAAGTQLIEIRHEMTRGQSVSRYRISPTAASGSGEFTTLRKARAAFRARVAEAQSRVHAGTESA